MVFKRFYDESISQASFLIGCGATGEAIVVDPNRDVETYISAAEAERLRITAVTETHIHADYVSGARELAARTGATLYVSAEGGPDWSYAFAGAEGVRLLREGDTITVGDVTLTAMHTPGHTPEHLAFLVKDGATVAEPVGMLSGDLLFVGDVGRPDLLEVAAGMKDTMRAGAETLFRSLERVKGFRPELIVWPGHGAGSSCGKALGGLPETTIGYELATNWALACDQGSFVDEVLRDQPEPPRYFATMKRVNKEGPAMVGRLSAPPRYGASRLAELLDGGTMVVDVRGYDPFEAENVRGTLGIPLDKSFAKWAGSLLDESNPVYLIATTETEARDAAAILIKIGIEGVQGWFDAASAMRAMRSLGRTGPLPAVEGDEFLSRLGEGAWDGLDVRGRSDSALGSVGGVQNVPLPELARRLADLGTVKPIGVHCQGGGSSVVATSYLRRAGIDARNVLGGYDALEPLLKVRT